MSRKVAIVAKAGTSALAPWHDAEWEIWGLPWISYPRVDCFFDMHEQPLYEGARESYWKSEEWVKLLDGSKPVYTFPSRSHLPGAVEYPLEEVSQSIPVPYLENSVAYMIALALHEGAEAIGLWGVHMRGAHEYEEERPSVTYLVGLAQGRGVDVHIPAGNPLMASVWEDGRYGVTKRRRPPHPQFCGREN